jgi:hypothetical protein
MSKKNEKYPIEVALEKFIVNLGRDIHSVVKFATHIPKSRQERMYWIQEIIVWALGVLAWTWIVAWAFRNVSY